MSKVKRVYISVTNDLSTDYRVFKVIKTLNEADVQVTLVGRKLKNSPPYDSSEFNSIRFSLLYNKGPLFYACYNIRLFLFLLFRKVDLLVSNDLDTLPANFFISKIKGVELVYDSHEYFTEVPELVHRPKVKKTWERIEAYIFPKLKHVYTVCDSIATIYTEKYGVNVKTVRNLPLLKKLVVNDALKLKLTKPYFIYQGALNLGRGIELMIETMKYLEDYQLVIAGGGDIEENLKDLVQQNNLSDRIMMTGKVPFNRLKSITQNALLGFSFEEDLGLNYRYALPNKLFDYMHAGIPTLVSDLPEMREVIETNGTGEVLKSREAIKIAEQIAQVFLEERNIQYKANTLKASQDLNWEQESFILKEIYKDAGLTFE